MALVIAAPAGAAASLRDGLPPDVRHATALPRELLCVPASDGTACVLVTEKSTQRVFVYEFGARGAVLRDVLPCTTGKVGGDKQVEGDLRTPEGVYWFTRYIPGETLPPLYGAGAFVMDYPNRFDRLEGKTGSGIWMHGVETDDRVDIANDTRGCVALRNDHFEELRPRVRLRSTPMVVVENVTFMPAAELEREAADIKAFVEDWRASWESKNVARYAERYASDFESGSMDLDAWLRHKEGIARRAGPLRVAVEELTALREKDRAWVTFRQEYASDGHADVGIKTLHLRADDPVPGNWRIVGESWRPLDEDFEILRPGTAVLTHADVAELAPDAVADDVAHDAADDGTGAAADGAPAPLSPERRAARDLIRADELPAALEPSLDLADRGGAPSLDAGELRPGPPRARADLRVVDARLGTAEVDRGAFRLLRPFAREDAGRIHVQVQLLNSRPALPRDAEILLVARTVGGVTATDPPGAGTAGPGRKLRVRQGELLEVACEAPGAAGLVTVTVTVRDGAGRETLVQDVLVGVQHRR